MTIQELLENSCKLVDIDSSFEVIVYDQSTQDITSLSSDDFITVLLSKLREMFKSVFVLEGELLLVKILLNQLKLTFPSTTPISSIQIG